MPAGLLMNGDHARQMVDSYHRCGVNVDRFSSCDGWGWKDKKARTTPIQNIVTYHNSSNVVTNLINTHIEFCPVVG